MYFLKAALTVGLGFVFLPSFISCFIDDYHFSKKLLTTIVCTILYVLFLWFFFWIFISFYEPIPFLLSAFGGLVISIIICFKIDEEISSCIPAIVLGFFLFLGILLQISNIY